MGKEFLLAIDAGHGLYTPGKRCLKALDSKETSEWFLNNRVSDFISRRAEDYEGFETIRVDDVTGQTDVSHRERCRRANEAGADLYLSNHHNAGINGGSGGGVVAFCMRGGAAAKVWRDALYEAVIAAGGIKGNRSEPLQEKNFNVLVWSDMSAVLLEYGFMDSKADVPVILMEEYARTVGNAVADCIAARAGLKWKWEGFSDVPADAWYSEAVRWAVEQGITKGVTADSFAPEQVCTRGQAVTFVWRLYGMGQAQRTDMFADIREDAYYEQAAYWAVEQGITSGMEADRFAPEESCTRGQIVTFLYRAEGMPQVTGESAFMDVPPALYCHDAVLWAVEKGITQGVDEAHFYPDSPCTRGEMVTFLYRAKGGS